MKHIIKDIIKHVIKHTPKDTGHRQAAQGSVLVLTMIGILILSTLITGLLTVGSTELYSTQNFHLSKMSYFTAVQGVEELRYEILENPVASDIQSIQKYPSQTLDIGSHGVERSYITGNLIDFENIIDSYGSGEPGNIEKFKGFHAPNPPGMSLAEGQLQFKPVVWKVQVTAQTKVANRTAYAEIMAGVYAFVGGE